tara:strand:+ start:692 stop:1453 length:762 start_codon:yes stop_codon:yes gene_type:complete
MAVRLLWPVLFLSAAFCQDLPLWVLNPPRTSECLYGIGISDRFREDDLSFSTARKNAAGYITRQVQVRVISGLVEVTFDSRVETRGYIVAEIDSLAYMRALYNAVQIDSFLSRGNAFVLTAIDRKLEAPSDEDCWDGLTLNLFQDTTESVPPWSKKIPSKEGFNYGVSVGPRYRSLKDSWDNSEKIALVNLAKQINVEVASLGVDYISDFYTQSQNWMEETTDTVIKGAHVLERRYDKKQDIYYTLIEYRLPQ